MARDEDKYKAGVDFEWVTAKNSNYKTRRFFTKAEKEAMKAPKAEPKPASKPATKAKPTPKKKEAPVTKDGLKGYRKGDVTTSPLPEDIAARTRQVLAATAKGTVDEKMRTRHPSAGATMKVSAKASGGVSPGASQKKDVRTGKTAAQAPVFMKKTGTAAQDSLAQKWAAAEKNMPAGLNFNDWKSKFGGKQWKPGEALDAYAKYKAKSGMAKGKK